MPKKKKKVQTTTRVNDATSKFFEKSPFWSILFLALSFLLFSIGIPLVQMKIDKFSLASEIYQFHGFQAILKQKYRQEQIDLNRYLNILLEEKLADPKTVRAIDRMKEIIDKRHKEYTVMATALLLSNPIEKEPNFKIFMEELGKLSLQELLKKYKEAIQNKPLNISQKIASKLSFWQNMRNLCYGLAGFIFILGTVFQVLSERIKN